MSSVQGQFIGQLSEAAGIEDQLARTLVMAASEVAHSECFDSEQRSEVYAILDTLKADTKAHIGVVGQWVSGRSGNRPNA